MRRKYVIHVAGGLANRMFQLAFATNVRKKYGEVLYDDKSTAPEFEHDKIDVSKIFPNFDFSPMPHGMYRFGGRNDSLGKVARRLPLMTGERYHISHSLVFDKDFIENIKSPGYVIGLFQNEKYFYNVREEVRKLFTFEIFADKRNQTLANEIQSQESVAVHIRKGDGYATWNIFAGTCPVEYYKAAVAYIKERHPNACFYIFTDSQDWVKANMTWLEYETIVDWNPTEGWGNHLDMQLMSLCKHNIIANSTYSWWGAWLNRNQEKVVIGPKLWQNNLTENNKREILPDNWIKI